MLRLLLDETLEADAWRPATDAELGAHWLLRLRGFHPGDAYHAMEHLDALRTQGMQLSEPRTDLEDALRRLGAPLHRSLNDLLADAQHSAARNLIRSFEGFERGEPTAPRTLDAALKLVLERPLRPYSGGAKMVSLGSRISSSLFERSRCQILGPALLEVFRAVEPDEERWKCFARWCGLRGEDGTPDALRHVFTRQSRSPDGIQSWMRAIAYMPTRFKGWLRKTAWGEAFRQRRRPVAPAPAGADAAAEILALVDHARLSSRETEILVAVLHGGETKAAVARRLGISPQTVRVLYHRGRKRIRSLGRDAASSAIRAARRRDPAV